MSNTACRVIELAIDKVRPDPAQVRTVFDEESIAGLAQSIESHGLQQPIRVRPLDGSNYQIIIGERRYRACLRLGRKTIPSIVVDQELTREQLKLQQLIENVQREGLNAMDLARAYKQLEVETGWTGQRIAEELGVAPATVSRHLRLLDTDLSIQQAVSNGTLSASTAYELSSIEDPAQRAALVQRAALGTLKRDDVSRARRARDPSASFARTTLILDAVRSITIGAVSATTDELLKTLEEAASHLRKAHNKGISIATLVRMLKDQARLATTTVIRSKGIAK